MIRAGRHAKAVPESTLAAKVIHADGSVTDLGVISRSGRPAGLKAVRALIGRMTAHGK
jgi:hypothetical protein